MSRAAILLSICLTCLLACNRTAGTSSGEVSPPPNWPIAGLTLPSGTHDAEFKPGPMREIADHLRRKRPFGTPNYQPPPPQWNAFFAFSGEPVKVFDHVDKVLRDKSFSVTETQDLETGSPNESRSHTFLSPDGNYSVSIRYWKISDVPGAKPFQLLVRDMRTKYQP